MVEVFDETVCRLGEGPLWHPELKQLFWFDILGKKLLTQQEGVLTVRQFEEHVSAAGWVDRDTLIVASESGLYRHDITSGAQSLLIPIEVENSITRSNDGRTDPWGGFWIGMMGKNAEPEAGSIYRYFRGVLRQIVGSVSISNAICFSPDRKYAYYCDTALRKIMRIALSPEDGWPLGEGETLVDLNEAQFNPDGCVVDAEGNLWNAQWGASRVAKYDANGQFLLAISFPAAQTSCPAFGGTDLMDLYVTSAAHGLTGDAEGKTYVATGVAKGQAEHRVIL